MPDKGRNQPSVRAEYISDDEQVVESQSFHDLASRPDLVGWFFIECYGTVVRIVLRKDKGDREPKIRVFV